MAITALNYIRKTTFNVECKERDCWIDRQGNIIPNETHHHVEKALELIASFDEESKRCGREPIHIEQFKAANMNRGYDAGEWLVIQYGYIAIEGYKAIYSIKKLPTSKQLFKIGCFLYNKVLMLDDDKNQKKKEKIRKEKEAQRERQWCIDNKEYYSDWKNQFHSPSGFIRRDYFRWKKLCEKHGICTRTRRTYFTSY